MKNKSAKDLAFDRERAKLGAQIKHLKDDLGRKDIEIRELRVRLDEAEKKCLQLQDWVDRLLEYTEVSEEDMRQIIQKDKDAAGAMEHLNSLLGLASRFSYF